MEFDCVHDDQEVKEAMEEEERDVDVSEVREEEIDEEKETVGGEESLDWVDVLERVQGVSCSILLLVLFELHPVLVVLVPCGVSVLRKYLRRKVLQLDEEKEVWKSVSEWFLLLFRSA